MKTYNDITIPLFIRCDRLISAFENEMDWDKVDEFTQVLKIEMMSHDFPPLEGYPIIIDENDLGLVFMNLNEITEEHIGQLAWKVTNGHHRAFAAVNAGLPHIPVELDYSCRANEKELSQ